MVPKETSSDIIFKCPYFKVERKKLVYPDGLEHNYYLEHGCDFVVGIAVRDNSFLMVKQYRVPLGIYTLEFPAGGVSGGESPDDAVAREFAEETGYACSGKTLLGTINPMVARSTVKGYIYHVTDFPDAPAKRKLDPTEQGLETIWVHARYLESLISSNKETDALTISSWTLFNLKSKK